MFIILILLLRMLSSKENSGINKRIYEKAFFRRNFSCQAPHSIMYLLQYPFPIDTPQPGPFPGPFPDLPSAV